MNMLTTLNSHQECVTGLPYSHTNNWAWQASLQCASKVATLAACYRLAQGNPQSPSEHNTFRFQGKVLFNDTHTWNLHPL